MFYKYISLHAIKHSDFTELLLIQLQVADMNKITLNKHKPQYRKKTALFNSFIEFTSLFDKNSFFPKMS